MHLHIPFHLIQVDDLVFRVHLNLETFGVRLAKMTF